MKRPRNKQEFLERWGRRGQAGKNQKSVAEMSSAEVRAELRRLRGEPDPNEATTAEANEASLEQRHPAVHVVDRGKPIFAPRPRKRPWK